MEGAAWEDEQQPKPKKPIGDHRAHIRNWQTARRNQLRSVSKCCLSAPAHSDATRWTHDARLSVKGAWRRRRRLT